jgi:uncharacterized protein (DUF983 family)
MEIMDENSTTTEPTRPPAKKRFIISGFVLLAAGALLIARHMGYLFPEWLFSWEMCLIGIGIYFGEKHNFKNPSFFILIAIGTILLLKEYWFGIDVRPYIWPTVLILIGLGLILKPRRIRDWKDNKRHRQFTKRSEKDYKYDYAAFNSSEDYMDSVSIFGGSNKNIVSKNFKGGEAVSIFGGTELNLMQADINGTIILELTQVFGGCKLIVPAHWEIKAELVNIFGGVDDKRPIQNTPPDPNKIIILKGTSIFGGIEIRSY